MAAPKSSAVAGSGTDDERMLATSVPPEPAAVGTDSKYTKMELARSASVKPANAAPDTVKDALSPGKRPNAPVPELKLPPVKKPKSSTALLKPGTLPSTPSEKLKVEDRLGACMPLKPFRPDALALPAGGRSNPIPEIVEVEPGIVIADVFVSVNVNVLVWELNSATSVAVEN
jgi:hypothetical protein